MGVLWSTILQCLDSFAEMRARVFAKASPFVFYMFDEITGPRQAPPRGVDFSVPVPVPTKDPRLFYAPPCMTEGWYAQRFLEIYGETSSKPLSQKEWEDFIDCSIQGLQLLKGSFPLGQQLFEAASASTASAPSAAK